MTHEYMNKSDNQSGKLTPVNRSLLERSDEITEFLPVLGYNRRGAVIVGPFVYDHDCSLKDSPFRTIDCSVIT
jgi:hypothetical protein